MKATPLSRKHFSSAPFFLYSLIIVLSAITASAGTTITPSLTVSEEYTDNLDRDITGKRDDFMTVISPGIRIDIAEPRHQASLSYSPGFVFYHRNSEDESVRHNAEASFSAQLSQQTELTATDSFLRTDEPRTTATPADEDEVYEEWVDPTLRRGRKTWYSNTAGVSLEHRFGKEDSFGVGYRHRLLENDDSSLEDSQRHTPWARLSYWVNPYFGLDADVSYERGVFESENGVRSRTGNDDLEKYQGTIKAIHRIDSHFQWFLRYTHTETDYDGLTPDYTIYDPGVGFSWTIAEDTTLDLDVGYFWQERDGEDEESGLSFKGNLGKTWRIKRGSFRLSGGSGYEEASYGAESLGLDIYYQAQAGATYDLTRELSLIADASYRHNKYVNTADQREDDVYNTSIGFRYRPAALRWMSFALTGQRYDVQSNDADSDVTENSVMFSVSLAPVTPYRLK